MNKLILTICFCSLFLFLFSCNMPDYTKDIETLYQQIKNNENGSTGDSDTGDSDTDTKPDEDSDTTPDNDDDNGSVEDTDTTPDNEPDEDENPLADEDEIEDNDETNELTLGNICTGQDKCYNADSVMEECPASGEDFFGQDAQYTNKCTAQSFTLGTGAQEGTVIDNNTGLIWEHSPSENKYTWDDAPNHCADLNTSNYGGKNNWRVPNPLEFMTIVDNSTYNPATNSNFTNMPTDSSVLFWTSKEYKGNTSYAYAFNPYYGVYRGYGIGSYLKNKTYKVLCVSGNEIQPATTSNFTTQTISASGVVTDSATGLMWQKEYETGKTWQQALKYCEDSTYAGYSDWRLPNKNELSSLINYEKSGSPSSYFPDMPDSFFWSSSTRSDSTDAAWCVDFDSGDVGHDSKANYNYVRCVR